MNRLACTLLALTVTASFAPQTRGASAADPAAARRANTVVLDATAVANLRLQTAEAATTDFEETVFALGRLEVYPGNRAIVSSRVPGRVVEINTRPDHAIDAGDTALVVEARQFDDPAPRLKLTAPLGGLVSALHVALGEPVSPDKPLLEIVDLTEIYAVARVPEHAAARLAVGQTARITVAAAGSQVFPAELKHVGTLADAASGTIEAAFRVPNPKLLLRPGMRAEFAIVVAQRKDVTAIPRAAVQGEGAQRFVYVKDFSVPHAFVKSPVVLGQANDRFVEVVSGLLPADEVVTQGAYALAFAGQGTLSLKAALDAAHGHEHAADGSELPNAPRKAAGADAGHDHGHDHDHDEDHASSARPWMLLSGVLFVALLIVSVKLKNATART